MWLPMPKTHRLSDFEGVEPGRNWVSFAGFNSREDGFWLWDNFAWAPRLDLMPIAVLYRLATGENNFFYTLERREAFGITDDYFKAIEFEEESKP